MAFINIAIDGVEGGEVVDLKSAKLLKSIGFDVPTYHYYQDRDLPFSLGGLKRVKMNDYPINHNDYDDWVYSAPTINDIKRWFENL